MPVEPPQTFALAGWLLLLLDVTGKMPAKPGMWERNANANALAPTAITTTPTVMMSIVFVPPPVADLVVEPILCVAG